MFLFRHLAILVLLTVLSVSFVFYEQNAVITSCQESTVEPVLENNTAAIAGVLQSRHVEMLSHVPPEVRELVLRDSPGGNVQAAQILTRHFDAVRITGTSCTSACVMMLTMYDNVCVERSVQNIRFHTVSTTQSLYGGKYCLKRVNSELTQAYVDTLPAGLQARVAALPSRDMLITISLDEFLAYYPEKLCDA